MGVSSAEKVPGGYREPYLGIWRYAVSDLKGSGLWRVTTRPLLMEYVTCLRLAAEQRAIAESSVQTIHHRAKDGEKAWDEVLPHGIQRNRESGMDHPHPSFAMALKHLDSARALADLLGLTPKARKALIDASKEPRANPDDPFASFDNVKPIRRRA